VLRAAGDDDERDDDEAARRSIHELSLQGQGLRIGEEGSESSL